MKYFKLVFLPLFAVMIQGVVLVQGLQAHEQIIDNELFVGTESAPAKVVKMFHQALQTGDAELAKSLLADDVLIYEGGGVERSLKEYASHHLLADINYLKNLKVTLLEHQVVVSDVMAVSNARTQSTGKKHGKPVQVDGMETIVLKKVGTEWKIFRIHWS